MMHFEYVLGNLTLSHVFSKSSNQNYNWIVKGKSWIRNYVYGVKGRILKEFEDKVCLRIINLKKKSMKLY